jgi:hypothetical protein
MDHDESFVDPPGEAGVPSSSTQLEIWHEEGCLEKKGLPLVCLVASSSPDV